MKTELIDLGFMHVIIGFSPVTKKQFDKNGKYNVPIMIDDVKGIAEGSLKVKSVDFYILVGEESYKRIEIGKASILEIADRIREIEKTPVEINLNED